MGKMQPTVLFGLDGATFSVLEPLMAAGEMPFLRDFVARGICAELRSTANPLTPPAWTSMITGRSPGQHGVYDFVRAEERQETFYVTLYNSSDIRCETVWSMASRQGRTVTHLNFPMMAPPQPVNGVVLPSMVQWRHIRKNVHPADLVETLKQIPEFKPDEWGLTYWEANEAMRMRAQNPKEEKEWVERNSRRDHQWFIILSHLIASRPTDLTAIVFDGVDKLQHLCWYLLDPDCQPAALQEWEQRMRGYLIDYFRQIDSYLEQVVRLAGPEANVFIASDHGFGPARYVFHVNTLLKELGYLHWRGSDENQGRDTNHEWSFANLDWEKTTAFAGTPSSNGIWLRAAGRPGENRLSPEEYRRLREKLTRELLEFRDPATGEQIVTRVLSREEAFPGPEMEKAPDLLLTLSDGSFVSVVDEQPVVLQRPTINGTHRPEGVLIGAGPAIGRGRLPECSILDISPILLHSLGLPIPRALEGRVPAGVFTEEFQRDNPIRYSEESTEPRPGGQAPADSPYSAEEEETIYAQLRLLGYME